MAGKKPPSREQKSWKKNFDASRRLLEQSYQTVAEGAFSESLIEFELMDAVANNEVIVTKKEQAQILVTELYRIMKTSPTEAGNVMTKFLKILEGHPTLDNLRKELSS